MRRLSGGGTSLALTLLASMLLLVALSVGLTFAFSNLAVRREVERLPPEVQAYLRARQEAERKGEPLPRLPPPPSRAHSERAAEAEAADARRNDARRNRGGHFPAVLSPRTQSFVRDVQRSLVQGGLVAAGLAALLSLLIARRVSGPLSAVAQAANRLAQGDLGSRAPVRRGDREVADLARAFNEMAANLQTLERERQQAVADIAHELRTPIAVMQARLDALEDGVYPLDTGQIELLSTQTQLLTRLVGDLRTLTLADAGRLGLNLRPTDLTALAEKVVRDLKDRAAARGVALQLQGPAAPLHADPDRLRQVTLNLVENALVHSRSRVDVRVEPGGEVVRLHVDDDGPGIPPASREAVFTRFTRLDESRSRHTGGSGLGLSIVRALAGAHGGGASAEASPLGGARLTVTLPARPSP
ncbi:sensor histidine kinase [Deinococcus hopiensis]|uniref:sensor histidine kinase n=1 Tax=Deinococcus hopiensis TaxID=309885 RepID=UPI001FEB4900|nr:ATP-binding protein [Deinococcus hopiensis]